MTLGQAISGFLEADRQGASPAESQTEHSARDGSLQLLTGHFGEEAALHEITAARLRDFLARWYVENVAANPPGSNPLPPFQVLITTLTDFFAWTVEHLQSGLAEECLSTLGELDSTVPRALRITHSLASWLRERGGAFSFPEYLTSFEEGGRSQYDIDAESEAGAIDGYFRIVRIEDLRVEAEDIVSEERVWPIEFPSEVAALLEADYIINLEVVRTATGWQITGCGLAYPPGTRLL